jgi:hypothetical protein
VRLRRKDGTSIDCLITTTARHDADGGIIGYQGIIRDVTELKRLSQIGQIVTSSLDIDEVYQLCDQQVRELLPVDSIIIDTVDREQGTVKVAYQLGSEAYESPVPTGTIIPLKGSVAEYVLEQ